MHLPLLDVRSDIDLPGESRAMLGMQAPIGLGDLEITLVDIDKGKSSI
jgi:hypothetical protein